MAVSNRSLIQRDVMKNGCILPFIVALSVLAVHKKRLGVSKKEGYSSFAQFARRSSHEMKYAFPDSKEIESEGFITFPIHQN